MTQLATWGVTLLGGGAVRPEKRVTARSQLPQKKCTGLALPMKRPRNSLKIESTETRIRQNRLAYSGSYEACVRSFSNPIGFGISTGIGQIFTAIPIARRVDITSA